MNIKCSKDTLIEGLNLVARTVSVRTPLPILECILLTTEENGIRLTANDLEMSIETAPIASDVIEAGSVALNAKLFNEIVRKMPGDLIHIETDNNYYTVFKSGRARFKILGKPGIEFPVTESMGEVQVGYSIKSGILREMIRQTIFSVATDDTKPILTGELIQYRDDMLNMVAVDGYRISLRRVEMPIMNADTAKALNIVVPAKALHELSRVLPADTEEDVRFYFTDKRIVFEVSSFTFMSRLLEGTFVRYDQILHSDFTTKITVNRISFLTGLERALLISSDNRRSSVKLEIQEQSIVITSNSELGNTSYDEIPAEVDGNTLMISFNTRYLVESLRALEEEKVEARFTTSLSPCIINGQDNGDCKYFILPLRTLR